MTPGGAGVGETILLEDDESSEEDDVLDEDTPGRFESGGRGVSSEEDDEDIPGRFCGRGVSSEDEEDDAVGVSSEGKKDGEPINGTMRTLPSHYH